MNDQAEHASRLRISSETRTASVAETQEFETVTERFADDLKTSEVIPSSPSILKRKRSLEMSESKPWIMNYDKIKINKKKNQHHRRFISGRRLIFLILSIFIFSVLEFSSILI